MLEERLRFFSDWYRVKRAIALCLLYILRLKQRYQNGVNEASVESTLTVENIRKAEDVVIRAVQFRSFQTKVKSLKSFPSDGALKERPLAKRRKSCTKTSALYKLDPFVDCNGLLRVGGRLKQACLPYKVKFPIILPRSSHVTYLIIKYFHEKTKHQGRGITLNEIRENGFWIVGGMSAVASYIANCVTCCKLGASVQEQKMANLPEDRLEPAPPFTNCAMDYFRPWLVKEGKKEGRK